MTRDDDHNHEERPRWVPAGVSLTAPLRRPL